MGPVLDDLTSIKDHDAVNSGQRDQPMADHDGGTPPRGTQKISHQDVGRTSVKVFVRLVQHHDGVLGQQQPGQSQTLPLPPDSW